MTFARVAALYDIHGNLPALEAVLAEVDASGVDVIVVGGDVANGPMPAGSLDALSAARAPARVVRGNGDRELVGAYDGLPAPPGLPPEWAEQQRWAADGLTRAHRDSLAAYEPTVIVDVEGLGSVCFCHGSPRSDEEILTELTPAPGLEAALGGVSEAVSRRPLSPAGTRTSATTAGPDDSAWSTPRALASRTRESQEPTGRSWGRR